jgi:hypothetical protein
MSYLLERRLRPRLLQELLDIQRNIRAWIELDIGPSARAGSIRSTISTARM